MVLIAMLRGVNVGGRNMIKMDALRELCGSLGCKSVSTLLQSGNVVLDAPAKSASNLAGRIEKSIEESHGFRPSVILRTPEEMENTIASTPFKGRDLDPAKVLVYFLAAAPAGESMAKVSGMAIAPEELHTSQRELYIYFANGMARPKLSLASVDRVLKVAATGRNWNTVVKLLEIAKSL